jgi:hypothetical protein
MNSAGISLTEIKVDGTKTRVLIGGKNISIKIPLITRGV